MIKSIGDNQYEIIKDILELHCPAGIELDPTYSKGVFYKKSGICEPSLKFDLFPQTPCTKSADACDLPLNKESIRSIMFDPPFLAGYTKEKPTGLIGERFHGFRYMPDLWDWYDKCLWEFHRILKPGGTLIIKCQDTVSSGKQWWSHNFLMTSAEAKGYYVKDLFVLMAKSRMLGHNHKNQKHARKFHSYFLVLTKTGFKK